MLLPLRPQRLRAFPSEANKQEQIAHAALSMFHRFLVSDVLMTTAHIFRGTLKGDLRTVVVVSERLLWSIVLNQLKRPDGYRLLKPLVKYQVKESGEDQLRPGSYDTSGVSVRLAHAFQRNHQRVQGFVSRVSLFLSVTCLHQGETLRRALSSVQPEVWGTCGSLVFLPSPTNGRACFYQMQFEVGCAAAIKTET